ncbi:MAG: branched-chain amino acid ABC transporter permease [Solirubrobacteraceae bacterium]
MSTTTTSVTSRRLSGGRDWGRVVPRTIVLPAVAVFGLLWLVPFTVDIGEYYLGLGTLALIFVVAGLGWNVLGGLVGQISFGHAVFFGAGAYVSARTAGSGVPYVLALTLGALAAAAYGVIWGYPTLRLRGPYFAIATIGVGEATRIAMLNTPSFTGGASGLQVSGAELSAFGDYQVALLLGLLAFAVHVTIQRSKFGVGLAAIRGDVDAASDVGVDPARYQVYALAASAALVGLAGGWYAHVQKFIEPNDVFGFELSVALILIPLIGGLGTLWGPLLGAFVYIVVQETLQANLSAALSLGIYGALVVAIILAEPLGLVGAGRRLRRGLSGLRARAGGD